MEQKVIQSLHEYERLVLPVLLKAPSLANIEKATGLEHIQIMRSLQWLSQKNLIELTFDKEEYVTLDVNGQLYKQHGLPEIQLLKQIEKKSLAHTKVKNLSAQEVQVSIGLLKAKGAILVEKKEEDLLLSITPVGKILLTQDNATENFLQKKFPINRMQLTVDEKDIVAQLSKRRQVVAIETKQIPRFSLTDLGKSIASADLTSQKTINTLTHELLLKADSVSLAFRPYDVTLKGPIANGARIHPMSAVIRLVKEIFIEMGFQEMKGPWIETAFWCMDSMWIPQDHPARDVQDTFFLQKKGSLPNEKLVQKVKDAHEHGANTGSTGYGYKWDAEKAAQLILRTHTTATTYRTLASGVESPVKYFYVGKVFRNEALDATHLPEFYQVEGFVMAPGLTLQHLLGIIKEFYAKLGYTQIRFRPTYNPYTEPSVEALYYDPKREKWMELINSGIFRPESLAPYGIKDPIIAWGLGLERLAMIMLEQQKLKDIIGATCDLDWLRQYKAPQRQR